MRVVDIDADDVVEGLHPSCNRLREARQRVGTHSSLARRLNEIGCGLSAKQLKALEEGKSVQMRWSDNDYLIKELSVHADYMFPTALKADPLVHHAARVLAEVIEKGGAEDYFHVMRMAFAKKPELTRAYSDQHHITY